MKTILMLLFALAYEGALMFKISKQPNGSLL